MIICVGGLAGCGRQYFSNALADRLGYHCILTEGAIREQLLRYRVISRTTFTESAPLVIPANQESAVYERVSGQLAGLHKMFGGVVLSGLFLRERSRMEFFRAAQKISATHFFWIETEAICDEGPPSVGPGVTSKATLARIRKEQQMFLEPFSDHVPMIFSHNDASVSKETIEEFCALVELRIRGN